MVVGADYINLIWVPDTFFVNEKVARFHAATQVRKCKLCKISLLASMEYFTFVLQDNQFLRITHLGEILRSMRLTVKVLKALQINHSMH